MRVLVYADDDGFVEWPTTRREVAQACVDGNTVAVLHPVDASGWRYAIAFSDEPGGDGWDQDSHLAINFPTCEAWLAALNPSGFDPIEKGGIKIVPVH